MTFASADGISIDCNGVTLGSGSNVWFSFSLEEYTKVLFLADLNPSRATYVGVGRGGPPVMGSYSLVIMVFSAPTGDCNVELVCESDDLSVVGFFNRLEIFLPGGDYL